jgi:TrmH family RNA methyltransferase
MSGPVDKNAMSKHKSRYGPDSTVKQLRQLRSPAERERTGTFYIEGPRIVAQAVQAEADIAFGVIAPGLLNGEHAINTVNSLLSRGIRVVELSNADFESISFKDNLQGIGAVVRRHSESLANVPLSVKMTWVALDGVGNPGNLGAIMRTCDAVGCAGLLLLGSTTDPYHPAAIRASMGSFFALRMIRTSFGEFVEWARANRCAVVGTTPTAEQEYREVAYPACRVLLIQGGSNSPQLAAKLCIKRTIPRSLLRVCFIGQRAFGAFGCPAIRLRSAGAHPDGRNLRFAQSGGRHEHRPLRDVPPAAQNRAGKLIHLVLFSSLQHYLYRIPQTSVVEFTFGHTHHRSTAPSKPNRSK